MNEFTLLDKKLLKETDNLWIFQEVASHIEEIDCSLLDSPLNIENLSNIPNAAKHIYYLWHFYSNVNGMGIEEYLFNIPSSNKQLMKILSAIREIGFTDLVNRFESGIKLALKDNFFIEEHNPEYFQELIIHESYDSFDKIDNCIYEISGKDLQDISTKYIRLKKTELFI